MAFPRFQGRNPAPSALPPGIIGYILRVSGRHQLGLLLLSVAVFLLSAVPLEIQRRIVNDTLRKGAIDTILWLAVAYLGVAMLEGALKLVLNIYRSWVSETAVLDLRHTITRLTADMGNEPAPAVTEGTEISMVLSEAEPIGGFVGISVSEPLLQVGVLTSVFGYLVYLQPTMAILCGAAIATQMLFVPLMQAAINRRAAERIQTLRSVGDSIAHVAEEPPRVDASQPARLRHVFALNMGIFKIKYSMNFLMNLTHHVSVAMALGVGAYLAVKGRIEIGTVVAFVSGLGKVIDPWGDLVNWYREMTAVRMRYRLVAETARSHPRPRNGDAKPTAFAQSSSS